MEKVLVSVLMTSYNREKYIGIAIESILKSTHKNFELIITDDLSKDNTLEIARSYAAKDDRVKVYLNDTNLGDYHNRNKAAGYAKGKYIKYLDADDYIYPHGLEAMVYYLEKYDTDNNIALGIFSLPQDNTRPYPMILSPREAYKKHFLENGVLGTAPCSTIINREIFLKEGGFSGKRMVGDIEMWLKLAARYNTILMPGHYTWYRIHEEQEISSYNNFRGDYFNVSIRSLEDKNCPLDEKDREICLRKVKKGFSRLMVGFLIRQRDIRLFRTNTKSSGFNLLKTVIHLLK